MIVSLYLNLVNGMFLILMKIFTVKQKKFKKMWKFELPRSKISVNAA